MPLSAYRKWLDTQRAKGVARSGTIGRVIENAVWLLGGKTVGAILSLIYIGMATRALGRDLFGQFVLILGTGQAVSAIVTFSTWQVVVNYGMPHLHSGNRNGLGGVLVFCVALDFGAALLGCVIATVGVVSMGPALGWDATLSRDALLFCFVMLLSFRSTAVGILRLYDRFGLSAAADSVTPIVRLIGALMVVLLFRPSVSGFLLAWAVAELLTAAAHWVLAVREARGLLGPAQWRGAITAGRDNPGLWRFAAITNMGTTLNALGKQFSVLLVGLVVGPAAAGGYRLAFQLGRSLAKLSDLLSRSMFAELARVHVVRTAAELRKLFRHATRFSIVAGVVIIALLLLIGKPALGLVAGRDYLDAYPLLLMLGAAAALDLGGSSFEPALMATGRAATAFHLRIATTVLQALLLAVGLPLWGVEGAALASLAASVLGLILFGLVAWRVIYRTVRENDVVVLPTP
ncbi:lipopolysaccharide biosynthesis protein [uncultured Sphingomonas sp.]|uniref:lipopolysaccharide biosynthesis protein n=1 Tax=uncultured Sphingomonas sp. TaxID=158754 RepID=UPI002600D75E|nr:lipopolysaccharide biosynthesis protein [uncultured Sphingomonas sp.]